MAQQPGTGVWVQPLCGSQASAVHTRPSSHTGGTPLPQPDAGVQVSTPLQAFPSSQVGGVPAVQVCDVRSQVSTPLQALPSSQAALPVQQPATGVCVHPVSGTQASLVQKTPSSQLGGEPGAHVPVSERHVSTPLHGLPSSHAIGVPG